MWYYVVLRAVLNMLVRNASPKGSMCLGALCLVCQDLSCGECNVISMYFMC